MNTQTRTPKPQPQHAAEDEASKSATGTEAKRKGGVEPAKQQAKDDWKDSAKESGD